MGATYTLQVGKGGEHRLELLNRVYNPNSLALLSQCGIGPNTRVLDLGCGIGILSCELAKQSRRVMALDASAEQLEIARRRAAERGLSHVEFVQLDAEEVGQLEEQFDLVYCRFLLAHLKDPDAVVRGIVKRLRPGGLFVAEESAGYDGYFCYPASKGYDAWVESLRLQASVHSTDFGAGLKLPTKLIQLGCTLEVALLQQVILTTASDKQLLRLGVEELGPLFVERGMASQAHIDALIGDLKRLEADPACVLPFVRVAQIVARTCP